MIADWKTQAPDGPMTDAHRAALAEWSRLLATGALPDPADEQITTGPAALRHQFGATIEGPTILCSRDTLVRRLGRLALWLVGKAVLAVAAAGLLTLALLALLADAVWAGLTARPRPALVALVLCAVALATGWLVG